jgi:Holliday junction resolvase RusA-like endonuclease
LILSVGGVPLFSDPPAKARVIIVRLAGTPKGKGRGRAVAMRFRRDDGTIGHSARVHSDPGTVHYENQLRFAADRQMNGAAPLAGPVRVVIEARFAVAPSWPKKRRAAALAGELRPCSKPDADNLLKCVDSFNGIIWQDDRQVVEATVYKVYSETPGLTIMVSELK